jgi:hypothetical protein
VAARESDRFRNVELVFAAFRVLVTGEVDRAPVHCTVLSSSRWRMSSIVRCLRLLGDVLYAR